MSCVGVVGPSYKSIFVPDSEQQDGPVESVRPRFESPKRRIALPNLVCGKVREKEKHLGVFMTRDRVFLRFGQGSA